MEEQTSAEDSQQEQPVPKKEEEPVSAALAFPSELERLLDVPLEIHVELGRKKLPIQEILKVSVGSVIELDCSAGSHLSIFANRTLIAKGEVVVVGDRYGVRVTEIVSPSERVRRLGGSGDAQ